MVVRSKYFVIIMHKPPTNGAILTTKKLICKINEENFFSVNFIYYFCRALKMPRDGILFGVDSVTY